MKNFILLLSFLGLVSFLKSQSCADCRYSAYVFDSVTVTNVKFGEGMNADGQNQELFMNVYQPVGDTFALRPVVIFAFGGGFINGAKEEGYVVGACERFAKAGYVAAAIDYRTGIDFVSAISDPLGEMSRVFFRPMQDMRASVQHMYWHADSAGNTWRIDTNMIIIGGASSGGITAINVAYCDKAAEFAMVGNINGINSLGGFYSTSGLHPSYSWRNNGVINIAGGTFNTTWIEAGGVPVISAHGDQDQTVPYGGGSLNLGILNIGLEGSYNVKQALDSLGTCNYLFTMVGEDHPSGSASQEYFDQIFNRFMPRMKAIVAGQDFCCNLNTEIVEGDSLQVTPGATVSLTASVTGQSGTPDYLWCGIPCPGTVQTTPTISATVPYTSSYYINIVTEGNCLATDFIWFAEPVLVSAENLPEQEVIAFPNPTQGEFVVNLQGNSAQKIELSNLMGQKLWERNVNGLSTVRLDISQLPAGIYPLSIQSGERVEVIRMVKN
ncbi:MAG: T9SS type A sorting domain-containing protein [Bacteroidia bacterium]|nr:T9SS type A sorting domain-containing protein [Bacteroidia bacterium]